MDNSYRESDDNNSNYSHKESHKSKSQVSGSQKSSKNDYNNLDNENENISHSNQSSQQIEKDYSERSESNANLSEMGRSGYKYNNEESEAGDQDDNIEDENKEEEEQTDEEDYEYKHDVEILNQIMPERKVRFKIMNYINKLRGYYKLKEFGEDFLGNQAAMIYAAYLISEQEKDIKNNDNLINTLKQVGFVDHMNFKVSYFTSYIDMSLDNGTKDQTFDNLTTDFMDCHSTLVEFDQHRQNLLSPSFNTVCIGMAFDNEKLTVVDIFTNRLVNIDTCAITEDTQQIFVKGNILNDKYGVFIVRIVEENNPKAFILSLNPQEINYDSVNKTWICKFKNAGKVFEELNKDDKKLYIEVYLSENPETIKYGQPNTEKIKIGQYKLGYRCQLENFPHPILKKEEEIINNEESQKLKEENDKRKAEEYAEREERNRRENKFNPGVDRNKLHQIKEEEEGDYSEKSDDKSEKLSMSDKKSDKSVEEKHIDNQSPEPYDAQLNALTNNIEGLKKENEELQRKIAIIFEYKKSKDNNNKKTYNQSSISTSTYHDTLTTAANLYIDLSTHRQKLEADLLKYEQSIKIQEERKKEVYKILMNYKEELINNAEDRKGGKIPQTKIQGWLAQEKKYEDEIKQLRILNIKNTLLLNRYNKELKKTEEYFEGLHYIDFEQLKIENNVKFYTLDFNREN